MRSLKEINNQISSSIGLLLRCKDFIDANENGLIESQEAITEFNEVISRFGKNLQRFVQNSKKSIKLKTNKTNFKQYNEVIWMKGNISHIKDEYCFIIDVNKFLPFNLEDELQNAFDDIHTENFVFAIDMDVIGLQRAIRLKYERPENDKIFLIDIARTLTIEEVSKFATFSLSDRAKEHPWLVVAYKVVTVYNGQNESIDLKALQEQIYLNIFYRTIKSENQNVLSIEIQTFLPSKNNISVNVTNPFFPITKEAVIEPITKEQREIFYEEPVNTTNALKAVMGYVPKDEKRICKFYNRATNRCFKGNNCRFEHVELLKDGWTRDKGSIKIDIVAQQIIPEQDQLIYIQIYNVINLKEFYAFIPAFAQETPQHLRSEMNKSKIRQLYRKIGRSPSELELVFILLANKVFYRARIIKYEENFIKVFFLDFGYYKIVKMENIYEWNDQFDFPPFLLYKCSLANVNKEVTGRNTLSYFKNTTRGKLMRAQVINNLDGLVIKLFDEEGFDIGEMSCAQGLTKLDVFKNVVNIDSTLSYIPG